MQKLNIIIVIIIIEKIILATYNK